MIRKKVGKSYSVHALFIEMQLCMEDFVIRKQISSMRLGQLLSKHDDASILYKLDISAFPKPLTRTSFQIGSRIF